MTTNTTHSHVHPHSRSGRQWAIPVILALALPVVFFITVKPLKVLPRLAAAPSYSLTNQFGQPVSSADLHGQVVLYDFVYTHCTTVCPAMTGQMLQVQQRLEEKGLLGEDVVLVTITFDPERDTPQRLREYAAQMHAEPEGWLWLTGDPITVKQIVGSEFGVYFEPVPAEQAESAGHVHTGQPSAYDFIHTSLFVLVDGEGMIRAEYQEMLDIDRAVQDIRLVVREGQAAPLLRPAWQAAHLVRAYP